MLEWFPAWSQIGSQKVSYKSAYRSWQSHKKIQRKKKFGNVQGLTTLVTSKQMLQTWQLDRAGGGGLLAGRHHLDGRSNLEWWFCVPWLVWVMTVDGVVYIDIYAEQPGRDALPSLHQSVKEIFPTQLCVVEGRSGPTFPSSAHVRTVLIWHFL